MQYQLGETLRALRSRDGKTQEELAKALGVTAQMCIRDSSIPARLLSDSLREAGVRLLRFKTGTPPRVHADSIDFSVLEEQRGDEPAQLFSTRAPGETRAVCHIAYTNEATKAIILENLSRSPLYSGQIKGTGPRYCCLLYTSRCV